MGSPSGQIGSRKKMLDFRSVIRHTSNCLCASIDNDKATILSRFAGKPDSAGTLETREDCGFCVSGATRRQTKQVVADSYAHVGAQRATQARVTTGVTRSPETDIRPGQKWPMHNSDDGSQSIGYTDSPATSWRTRRTVGRRLAQPIGRRCPARSVKVFYPTGLVEVRRTGKGNCLKRI